jgi:hypothetical protein
MPVKIKLIDNDEGTLRAVNGAHVVKSWAYTDSTLRAVYREARAFCDGWHAALEAQQRAGVQVS